MNATEPMKTKLAMAMGLLAAGMIWFYSAGSPAAGQTGSQSSPGTPPVGRIVDVTVVSWPLTTASPSKVSGTLVAMTDKWIIVAAGNQEVWVPIEKVLYVMASR